MKLSVIIPAHNAAETITRSLDSLRLQGVADMEAVIADDGSTDGTSAIIETASRSLPFPCKTIRQENGGVASARNAALKAAEGEYLAFLDADDSLQDGALAKALQMADKGGLDIVGWDWEVRTDAGSRIIRQPDYPSPSDGLKLLLCGNMRWNLWLFLFRRSFIEENRLSFIDGADMGEDMLFVVKAFSLAKSVSQIHEPMYIYTGGNEGSVSASMSQQRRNEVSRNFEELRNYLAGTPYDEYLPYLQLYIKRPLLLEAGGLAVWKTWFQDCNAAAGKAPGLPLYVKLLERLAASAPRGIFEAYRKLYLSTSALLYR